MASHGPLVGPRHPRRPHHVTQRGNQRLPVFFCDEDRTLYVDLIVQACKREETRCLAWCLTDNHVHLILVPSRKDGLRATLAEAHRRYSRHVNFREGSRGYLFQVRLASYPMEDAYLMAAMRYAARRMGRSMTPQKPGPKPKI